MKTLMIEHSGLNSLSLTGQEYTEESKEGFDWSDTDSNVESTYTDSHSQDILMKAKTSAWNCLKVIFKFGQKMVFNYR